MSAEHLVNSSICSACGGKPRVSEDGKRIISLKRCTRCQQAWYHDIACQKQHYSTHKDDCRRWSKDLAAKEAARQNDPTGSNDTGTLKVRVEPRSGRGNCLVASQQILRGDRITPGLGDAISWDPLVLPVLLENQRRIRCTLCFGMLDPSVEPYCYESSDATTNWQGYPLLFCSIILSQRQASK